MAGLLDTRQVEAKKLMLAAPSGAGKSGALASLVCLGYKLRLIDTDNGFRPLRSLLTDYHYPYRKFCETHGIELETAVSAVPVTLEMIQRPMKVGNKTVTLLVPKNELAWDRATGLLNDWRDGDLRYGNIDSWGEDCVLVQDTFSTLAKMAYYNVQAINGRLGAMDSGYDYQRDIGGAQSILQRMLELLYSTTVRCNVIINTHVTWVDQRQGRAMSPDQVARDGATPNPDGLPAAIGRALSPQMGKYFNDVFTIRVSGSGENVRRQITTVPMEGVVCKHSVWMKREYDISTGLAEIFCALDGKPEPEELMKACGRR
jgi:hypothetical protein